MILVFSSITYALKAQKLLTRAGISSDLIRSPRVREIRGCGYGLKVAAVDAVTAQNVCGSLGIKVLSTLNDTAR